MNRRPRRSPLFPSPALSRSRHFVAQAAKRHRLEPAPKLSAGALERLLAYRWPGNVRELENCMESAVVLCDGEILAEHLPLPDVSRKDTLEIPAIGAAAVPVKKDTAIMSLAEIERRHILGVLELVKGNRTAAAKALGIGRNTLARKLKEFGLDDDGS